jgi:hypothetical protein
MGEKHPGLALPELNDARAEYIIALLFECGPIVSNGMGPSPVSWTEISNWLTVTEKDYLPLWEKQMIKTLSEAYVSEYVRASEHGRPDPFVQAPEKIDREAVATSILSTLRSIQAGRDAGKR